MKIQYNNPSKFKEGNIIYNVWTKESFRIVKVVPKGTRQKEIFFKNTKKEKVLHNSATSLSFCKNIILYEV